jgi:hypothetical protein
MTIQAVQVEGLAELKRSLMTLAKEASGPEVKAAILGVANEMKGKMRQRANKSLRYAIVAKPFLRNRKNVSRSFVTIDRRAKDGKSREFGRLADILEGGTQKRKRKGTKHRGGGLRSAARLLSGDFGNTGIMPAQPFFYPVVNEYRGGKMLSRMRAIMKKQIERSARRGINH